jgi:hypothetical protein
MNWEPLSVRTGKRSADETLYEGVPPHLSAPLGRWVSHSLAGMPAADIALFAAQRRIAIEPKWTTHSQIVQEMEADLDLYLDCVDQLIYEQFGDAQSLHELLEAAGSAWTLNSEFDGLERRTDETARSAMEQAVSEGGAVGVELSEAWAKIFGRNPDPSDAWDHAIKAVEDLLIPVVIPGKSKPNLGGVAGELKANHSNWELGMPANGDLDAVQTVESLIRLLWPNPDRHGGSTKRPPTQQEAENAVHIAVLLVNLCRGSLIKK